MDTQALLKQQPQIVQNTLWQFDKALVSSFYDWVFSQFNVDVHQPSPRQVFTFMHCTLNEYLKCGMSVNISWSTFFDDWELDEPFMDFFGD